MDISKDGQCIDRGYQEMTSVPLPGIKDLKEDLHLKDVTYTGIPTMYIDTETGECSWSPGD